MRTRTAIQGTVLVLASFSQVGTATARNLQGQDEDIGNWIGPYDLTPYVCPEQGACGALREFAHASLIPKGPHAGKVLLFRFENQCDQGTLEVWMFDPANPTILSSIEHPALLANFFCSGMSWDRDGNLLCAGGIDEDGVVDYSSRFLPEQLPASPTPGFPQVPFGCDPHPLYNAPNCWSTFFQMQVIRWYPTVLTLLPEPLTEGHVDCRFPVGSAQVVFGGPPDTGSSCGADLWELVAPGGLGWTCTMGPPNTSNTDQNYALEPMGSEPEPLLDSYPRSFQLSGNQKRRILISGDTDTDKGNPPGTQLNNGESWVMELPYEDNPATNWVEYRSGTTNADRSYHSAVLLHKLGSANANKDRVLVFGGGRWEYCDLPCNSNPMCSGDLEAAHDSVDEFIPDPNDAGGGTWQVKTALNYSRMYPNAVVLPTGKVFVEGGHGLGSGNYRFIPELYDPGSSRTLPGSTMDLRISNDADGYTVPTQRLYHHLAVLLPDGRVMVGGGQRGGSQNPDSRYSFEIYYPPYLFQGQQPLITNVAVGSDGEVDYGEDFRVNVTTFDGPVDSVVLLRPAALTHHFDPDQRYIELDWTLVWESGGDKVLSVTALADDLGPEGYYMLFVLELDSDGDRIPSVAKFVRFAQQP